MAETKRVRGIKQAIRQRFVTRQRAAEAAGAHYTHTDAAKDLGVTRQGFCRWLDGALPNAVWLPKLARWLDMPIDSLRALHDLERGQRAKARRSTSHA